MDFSQKRENLNGHPVSRTSPPSFLATLSTMSSASVLPRGIIIHAPPRDCKPNPWKFYHVPNSITIPAGTYYVGDRAYMLSHEDACMLVYGAGGGKDGLYVKGNDFLFLRAVDTSHGMNTSYYRASDGKKFRCYSDSLCIATVPLKQKHKDGLREEDDHGYHMYTFDHPVICDFHNGFFAFRKEGASPLDSLLTINTHYWISRHEYEDEGDEEDRIADQDAEEAIDALLGNN